MTVTLSTETFVIGYAVLHVLYGVVTHYHSIAQCRKYNKGKGPNDRKISTGKVIFYFFGRMLFGMPWKILTSIAAPVRNPWHHDPSQMRRWGND